MFLPISLTSSNHLHDQCSFNISWASTSISPNPSPKCDPDYMPRASSIKLHSLALALHPCVVQASLEDTHPACGGQLVGCSLWGAACGVQLVGCRPYLTSSGRLRQRQNTRTRTCGRWKPTLTLNVPPDADPDSTPSSCWEADSNHHHIDVNPDSNHHHTKTSSNRHHVVKPDPEICQHL